MTPRGGDRGGDGLARGGDGWSAATSLGANPVTENIFGRLAPKSLGDHRIYTLGSSAADLTSLGSSRGPRTAPARSPCTPPWGCQSGAATSDAPGAPAQLRAALQRRAQAALRPGHAKRSAGRVARAVSASGVGCKVGRGWWSGRVGEGGILRQVFFVPGLTARVRRSRQSKAERLNRSLSLDSPSPRQVLACTRRQPRGKCEIRAGSDAPYAGGWSSDSATILQWSATSGERPTCSRSPRQRVTLTPSACAPGVGCCVTCASSCTDPTR